MSRAHMVLQGLRHTLVHTAASSSGVVLDREHSPIYRPIRQPLFFIDGSLAVSGREPQLVCDEYRLKLRQADGHTCWVRVSPDDYQQAVIGQPFAAK